VSLLDINTVSSGEHILIKNNTATTDVSVNVGSLVQVSPTDLPRELVFVSIGAADNTAQIIVEGARANTALCFRLGKIVELVY